MEKVRVGAFACAAAPPAPWEDVLIGDGEFFRRALAFEFEIQYFAGLLMTNKQYM
jgi:hypothetical protein